MRKSEVDYWVLQVADRVKAGQQVEDARVETKLDWPSPDHTTARQLAGLANAARGEPVLVLIGVDPRNQTIESADCKELANWWPAVSKWFNGVAPDLEHDLVVPYGDKALVALVLDTRRAPFVVTVPSGGPIDRDVPWREGTRTRSATREDLLRLLIPVSRAPNVERIWWQMERRAGYMNATVRALSVPHLDLEVGIYVTPRSADIVVFPDHRSRGAIRWPGGEALLTYFDFEVGERSQSMRNSGSDLTVTAPGFVVLRASAPFEGELAETMKLEFEVTLTTTEEQEIKIAGALVPRSRRPGLGSAKDEITWGAPL
jgi:hypothetical protein